QRCGTHAECSGGVVPTVRQRWSIPAEISALRQRYPRRRRPQRSFMDRIRIEGGARLEGAIPISGAKNAALPLMAAALLTGSPLVLANVPKLADIAFMLDLLKSLGVKFEHGNGSIALSASSLRHTT